MVQLINVGILKSIIWKQAYKKGDTKYEVSDYV